MLIQLEAAAFMEGTLLGRLASVSLIEIIGTDSSREEGVIWMDSQFQEDSDHSCLALFYLGGTRWLLERVMGAAVYSRQEGERKMRTSGWCHLQGQTL